VTLNAQHHFDVADVADPTPGTGELVLKVHACGICGSDLKAYGAMPPGTVLGHEFSGEIVAAADLLVSGTSTWVQLSAVGSASMVWTAHSRRCCPRTPSGRSW